MSVSRYPLAWPAGWPRGMRGGSRTANFKVELIGARDEALKGVAA